MRTIPLQIGSGNVEKTANPTFSFQIVKLISSQRCPQPIFDSTTAMISRSVCEIVQQRG